MKLDETQQLKLDALLSKYLWGGTPMERKKLSIRKIARMVGIASSTVLLRKDSLVIAAQQKAVAEKAAQLSKAALLRLENIERDIANVNSSMLTDTAEVDTLTRSQAENYKFRYTPADRISIKRGVVKTFREVHMMMSMSLANQAPKEELDAIEFMTKVIDKFAKTPEEREEVLKYVQELEAAEDDKPRADDNGADEDSNVS